MFLAAVVLSLVAFASHERFRYVLQFSAGAIAAIIPLLVLNLSAYGNPLGPQVASNYDRGLSAFISFSSFFPTTSNRWMILSALIMVAIFLSRVAPASIRSAFMLAGMEISTFIAVVLTVLYLSNRWGISSFVEASPWIVLVPWVLVRLSTDRLSNRSFVAKMLFISTAFTFLVVLSSPVTGGSQWGGRLFVLVTPLWVILGVMSYRQLVSYVRKQEPNSVHRFLLPAAFCTILMSSFLTQVASVEFLSLTKRSWEPLGQLISEFPRDTVLATNSWWIPLVLAPDFYNHYIFHVDSEDDLCQPSHSLLQNRGSLSLAVISTPGTSGLSK